LIGRLAAPRQSESYANANASMSSLHDLPPSDLLPNSGPVR